MILKHAPAIIAAANALAARARAGDARASADGFGERIDRLEAESRDAAQLLQDIAQQLNALAVAQQALAVAQQEAARRGRIATALAAGAVVLGICACLLVLLYS
jgi:type VI protein secretion system component VasF